MLSMDSREMKLMYKAFCEWQKKSLSFIKSDEGETVPCYVSDRDLFESKVYVEGEHTARIVPTECLVDDSRRRKRALKRIDDALERVSKGV